MIIGATVNLADSTKIQFTKIADEIANDPGGFIYTLWDKALEFGLKFLAAILIYLIGAWVIRRIRKWLTRRLQKRKAEETFSSFVISLTTITLTVVLIIIAVSTLGVNTTSLAALLASGGVAIGMALSGTMQNFAGGIIIMFLKPFRVGDIITTSDGKTGVVKKIMIFTTEIHTFDNQVILLPNGALSNSQITNLSMTETRRMDFTVSISYGDNIDTARKEILAILTADARVLHDPAPVVFVADLADSAVVLGVRYWTAAADCIPSRGDMIEQIYNKLPKKKIHFPFPQMDVHVTK